MTNDNASLPKNQRPVRSYVLRQGRITPAQEKALKNLWAVYGINNQDLIALLNQSKSPVVLEIGFGMGQSLAAQAKAHPEIQYIGIEVHKAGIGSLLLMLNKENIYNIKILSGDAVEILQNHIPDHSLDKIQIFFPDPWPKKRHHKRRLIQKDFVSLIHQKLKTQGILHIATDWEDYADFIMTVISTLNLFDKKALTHDRPMTKFELRGKKLGHQVWDLLFVVR